MTSVATDREAGNRSGVSTTAFSVVPPRDFTQDVSTLKNFHKTCTLTGPFLHPFDVALCISQVSQP